MTGKNGQLRVVGTGIKLGAECTLEARGCIQAADVVFTVVDGLTLYWIRQLNDNVETLSDLYGQGRTRGQTYEAMTARIVAAVKAGQMVCAVFYGHPGVFVDPSHEAIAQLRKEGFDAKMMPGISAEDCLFADLGFDPGRRGCQSYEATDFFINKRRFDPRTVLIIWQIAVVGDVTLLEFESDPRRLALLAQVLMEDYPPEHEVVVYEAATIAIAEPRIDRMRLDALPEATVTQLSTLYIPPVSEPSADPARLALLGYVRPGSEAPAKSDGS